MASLEGSICGDKKYFLIGRLAPSELCPQGVLVSRYHCILYEHKGFNIASFSGNGTYVNPSSPIFRAKHEIPRLTNDPRFISLFRFYMTEAGDFGAVDRLRGPEVELVADKPENFQNSLMHRLIDLMKNQDFLGRLSELSVKLEDGAYIGIPLHKMADKKEEKLEEAVEVDESIFEHEQVREIEEREKEVNAKFYTLVFRK